MRIATILAVALLGTTSLAAAEHAQAAIQHYQLNIPRQSLDTALKDLAQQTGLQIGRFSARTDGGAMVGPVLGDQTPAQALKTLLHNTGLEYKIVSDTTIAVYNPKDAASARFDTSLHGSEEGAADSTQSALQNASGSPGDASASKEAGKKSSQDFRVAQVDQGKAANTSSIKEQSSTAQVTSKEPSGGLQEIIVTAQKREERLMDVPVPVTAISAESLMESNQTRLQDYYSSVPGLAMQPSGAQANSAIAIRGITTGSSGGGPTVGITIDDIPFGSAQSFLDSIPDLDPGDLARVEVLRGPQGTLYGSNSMGGLIKFVTIDPSSDGVSGHMQAGTSTTQNGAELGYNFRGSVNVPINETLAVRASGFTRQDPGYIDNPVLHLDGVNQAQVAGGLLSALWRPTDGLSLKVFALYQHIKADGQNGVDIQEGLGGLQQSYTFPQVGGYDKKDQAYGVTLKATVAGVDVTSLTGYTINTYKDSWDVTWAYGSGLPESVFPGTGATADPFFDNYKTDKFSQEVRLNFKTGEYIDWLLGGFFTHESTETLETTYGGDPITGQLVGVGLNGSFPATYREYAAFADATVHVTDRFNVQIGGRESQLKQTAATIATGPYVPIFDRVTSPLIRPEQEATANRFTYLVTPQFKFSPDFMLYARLASGYRPGGINVGNPAEPPSYGPDSTRNYEVGAKGDFLEHRLTLDASVYDIEWKGIQVSIYNQALNSTYVVNGNQARSSGVELSVGSRPVGGLTLSGWVAFDDAKLTQSFPPGSVAAGVYGVSGDRLPLSSRLSGNISLQEEFPLSAALTGSVGATASYVGDRLGDFQGISGDTPQPRSYFPSYTKTDLRAGLRWDSWAVNLFVNNVADKRGLIAGGAGTFPPFAFYEIQPRTVGISIKTSF